MSDPSAWGIETWRGMVAAWHCDEMGHQSARTHAAQSMEGLRELLASLGLSPRDPGEAAVIVAGHHMRFARELRAGTPLHLRGAVIEMSEGEAVIAQLLCDEVPGSVATAFQVRCRCIDPATGAARPWPDAVRAAAAPLRAEMPAACLARGVPAAPVPARAPASLAAADRAGMMTSARGVVSPDECDHDGRCRVESIIARFSDATRLLMLRVQQAVRDATGTSAPLGAAGVEAQLRYHTYPCVGDRLVVRNGISMLSAKTRLVEYWMLDPASGRIWAEMRSLEVLLDMTTRRAMALPEQARHSLADLLVTLEGSPAS